MTTYDATTASAVAGPLPLLAEPRLLVVGGDPFTAHQVVTNCAAAWPDVALGPTLVPRLTDAQRILLLEDVDCVLVVTDGDDVPDVAVLVAAAPGVPVVVVTDDADGPNGERALDAGAHDVLGRGEIDPPALRRAIVSAARRALATRRAATLGLGAAHNDIFALVDRDGVVRHVGARTCEAFGLTGADLVGANAFAFVHPADSPAVAEALATTLDRPGERVGFRARVRHPDGAWRELDLAVTNLLDDHRAGALVVTGQDITDLTRANIVARLETRILDRLPAAVVVTDDAGVVVYWNQRATVMYGYTSEETLGREVQTLALLDPDTGVSMRAGIAERGRWDGEALIRRKDGSRLPLLATLEAVEVAEIGFRGVVSASLDNTERSALRDTLAHQALHDRLTGLPNRTLFLDRVDQALMRLRRNPGVVAVLVIDLDRFKLINDTCGHHAGDEILKSVAALFSGVVRSEDSVARLGGDEFAVCGERLRDPADAVALAERLTAGLAQPFVVGGREFYVSPSIGIVLGTGAPGETAATLLRDADAAMYHAKGRGRGRIELFDSAMREHVIRRADTASQLRRALDRDEFALHYQPIVDIDDGRLVGFEALLRWNHPERGLLVPGDFMDIAEDTNLIVPIGSWVIDEAARQLALWRDERPEHPMTMSVNLSARQVADPALVATVRAAVEAHHLDPAAFCLEITESVLVDDADGAVATMRQLKSLGVQLAIDDFGTGYSSLAYLKRFPIDYLKLDRSFVNDVAHDTEDAVIVGAVLELGRALGLTVVAEGVETDEQLSELARLGCELAQGYRWSMPRPPAEMTKLANAWQATALPAGADGHGDERRVEESAVLSSEELLSVLTHEIVSPLTVVLGQCDRLAKVVGDVPRAVNVVANVRRNAERIETLVSTLSDAQQLDAGTLSLHMSPFDLVDLVRDVAPLVVPEGRPIEIVGDVLPVEADGRRIEQIVVNLLTNADKFSPPGTPIVVTIGEHDGEAAVVVTDEGPGVPHERVADIFRKFARVERTKKGVGLGLYIARCIARAHGGDVHYRRRHPVGSEFVLTLPRQGSNR